MCAGLVLGANTDSLKKAADNASGQKQIDIFLQLAHDSDEKSADTKIKYAQKALELSEKSGYIGGKAASLFFIAQNEYSLKHIESSKTFYLKSLPIFQKLKDSAKIGLVFTGLGYINEDFYKFDTALILHRNALKCLEKYGTKREYAIALNNIGMIIWRNGAYAEALPFFNKALAIRKEINSVKGIGMSLNNIGSLYWRWGNYEKALDYFQQALKYREMDKDTHGIVLVINNMGLVYQRINQLDKASEYFNEAISLSVKNNFTFGKAFSYHNISQIYSARKDFNRALDYSLKSLDNYNMINEAGGIVSSLGDIGEYYENLGKYKLSLEYFNKALLKAIETEDRFSTAYSYFNLGRVASKMNEVEKSINFIVESLKMAERQGMKDLIKNDYLILAKNYSIKKEYKKAYDYMVLYDATKDSLYNEKLIMDLANWRVRYETEKKINENKLLRDENSLIQAEVEKQKLLLTLLVLASVIILIIGVFVYRLYYIKKRNNVQISQQKNELEKLNVLLDIQNKELFETSRTKDKLFSVVAHDLKNPFQALVGYSEILVNDCEELSPDKIKSYARNINESSKNLLGLTRNLLDWARLQSEKITLKPEAIQVNLLMKEIVELYRFNIMQKRININCDIEEGFLVTADRHMLNTVMRNLLSNAIKFTNSEGAIRLSAEIKNGEAVFAVTDSGIGMSREDIESLFNVNASFSKQGTENEKGTGLGLLLCKEFVEKAGGKIQVESEEGKGSCFKFILPV
jgi:signal transduction histidine kinase/Flp pilus assembly protein TadD